MAENARLMARLGALNQQNPIATPVIQSTVGESMTIQSAVEGPMTIQSAVEEPMVIQQEPQPFHALQLIKPEPQHLDQQSPLYMELSPSAKPSNASLNCDDLNKLTALLNLNALQAALNQATSNVAASFNTSINNQMSSVDSTTAALLSSVLANSANQLALNSTPSLLPFRNIDLINDGLLPSLPLLYPYNTNAC